MAILNNQLLTKKTHLKTILWEFIMAYLRLRTKVCWRNIFLFKFVYILDDLQFELCCVWSENAQYCSLAGKVDTRTSRSSVGTWFLFCQPWTFCANVDGLTKSGEPRSRINDGDFEIFVQRCLFTYTFRVNILTPAALSCFPVWSWQLLFSDISQENGSGRCHKRPCIHCQEQESNILIVLQLLPNIHWDFVPVKPLWIIDIADFGHHLRQRIF